MCVCVHVYTCVSVCVKCMHNYVCVHCIYVCMYECVCIESDILCVHSLSVGRAVQALEGVHCSGHEGEV